MKMKIEEGKDLKTLAQLFQFGYVGCRLSNSSFAIGLLSARHRARAACVVFVTLGRGLFLPEKGRDERRLCCVRKVTGFLFWGNWFHCIGHLEKVLQRFDVTLDAQRFVYICLLAYL